MAPEQKSLPIWILIVSAFFAVMEIAVSISLYAAPESVADTVDLKAKGVDYLMQIWATRQFALGVIFAFATYKRSIPMLIISYIFFFVMFMGDIFIGISQKENSLIIAAIIMCTVSASMIYALNKRQ